MSRPAAPAFRAAPAPYFQPIEWAIVGLMALAILALAFISQSVLTAFKVHYVSAGGGFYEKLHPATYLIFIAFFLVLVRGGDPIRQFDRIISSARLLLIYSFCLGLLVVQCIVSRRPFTSAVDTFLLPVVISVVMWSLAPSDKRPLAWALHFAVWVNIAAGYYEYFSGHRLVPITVGGVPVFGEWRSTAFLGSPIAASSVVALYTLTLILRPELVRPAMLRIPAIVLSLGSLMAFGGRTALVSVLFVIACLVLVRIFRLARGARAPLPMVILTICALFLITAGVLALLQSGTFDNMLNRFSTDKGSAHARVASLHMLSLLDWREIAFGTDPAHGGALQFMMGLQYGIESFWIACIVQYGLIYTGVITLAMACFFVELLRRSDWRARVAVLFIFVDASSSVSFSSKNVTLALLVTTIAVLLPRERTQSRALPEPAPRHAAPFRLSPITVR